MLDAILFRSTAPYLMQLGERLAANVSAATLTVAAFITGAAALPAIGFHKYWVALGLLVLHALLGALAGIVARTKVPPRAALARVLDLVLSAAVPFAFALAMPERALAAMFLLLGLVVRAGSASTMTEGEDLVGRTELFLAFTLACVFPDRFSIIAYVIGVLCFVGAGQRVARA
jgi:hypothetical protein